MQSFRFLSRNQHGLTITTLTLAAAISLTACAVNQPPAAQSATTNQAPAAQRQTAEPVSKLNINTASEAELLQIPGVGEKMVDEFLEYRPFTNLAHFRKEIGKYVDATQLTEYEKYIVID